MKHKKLFPRSTPNKTIDLNKIPLSIKELAFDVLFSYLPISFYWMDRNGILLGCNEKVLKDLNISSLDEFVGKHASEVTSVAAWENSKEVMNSQQVLTIEEMHKYPDDSEIIYLSIKSPLYNKKHQVIGLVGISIDVSDRKKAEEALKESKIATEKMQAMKMLAASIAHELRTPLRSVNMAAGGIKKYFPMLLQAYQLAHAEKLSIPEIDPYYFESLLPALDSIGSETQEALNIIDMLLTNLNWVSNPLARINAKPYYIMHSVEEALRRYFFDIGQKELVHWKNEHNFVYKGDELLVVHILFNLLKNAFYQIKAAEKGEIYIWTEQGQEYNSLHFKDTAKGIPPEMLPYVFDQFFTSTYHGAGIGLAFCKMVMDGIGGRITCQSESGKYAEFVLYFPLDEGR